jgi:hypothetical protein
MPWKAMSKAASVGLSGRKREPDGESLVAMRRKRSQRPGAALYAEEKGDGKSGRKVGAA